MHNAYWLVLLQIVTLLNDLYVGLDKILAKYDVFKVCRDQSNLYVFMYNAHFLVFMK